MPLHPQVAELLEMMADADLPRLETVSPGVARQNMLDISLALGKPDVVASVAEVQIPGPAGEIPARVYTPRGDGPFALMAYYHGGGWVIGDVQTHDALCRHLAETTQSVIVSVDYRLAPEHIFPAAAEDCYSATVWAAENASELNADAHRLVVAGDSAGGNLAAVVALMARDRDGPKIALQVLAYPITDCDLETPSYIDNAEGYVLTRPAMVWFWDHYVPDAAQRTNPYVSPLRAESLADLPPAYVMTAEFDPLRDEGEIYAKALEAAGVPTVLERFEGHIHGFLRMTTALDVSHEAMRRIRDEMQRVF